MGGRGYIRLVVGYTWTWASLDFATGLVVMELRVGQGWRVEGSDAKT